MKNLFNYDDPPKKVITYSSLNIQQKINYRANLGAGFHGLPYLNFYYYFKRPLIQPIIDQITSKYYIEYSLNAGTFNRLDNYLKAKNPNLFT